MSTSGWVATRRDTTGTPAPRSWLGLLHGTPITPHPRGSPTLESRGLSLRYAENTVVEGLDFLLPPGAITVLVGANGCGNRHFCAASHGASAHAGAVLLDDKDIARQPTAHVAKRLRILPRSPTAPDGITVAELVGRGRQPHRFWFDAWTTGMRTPSARRWP